MKKIRNLSLLLMLICCLPRAGAVAQSIKGSWKKTAQIMVLASGKRSDSFKDLIKTQPCYANIIYSFLAGGKMSEELFGCDEPTKKVIAASVATSTWRQEGNKLTLSGGNTGLPPALYEISFSGNRMTWVFNFADNPSMPNIKGRTKTIIITYEKIN